MSTGNSSPPSSWWRSLVSTLERECADQGEDWEDVIDQISIEESELAARKLTRVVAAPGSIANDPSDAAGEGGGVAG